MGVAFGGSGLITVAKRWGGKDKKKKKREERMGTLEVKGRAWPRVEKSRGSEKA